MALLGAAIPGEDMTTEKEIELNVLHDGLYILGYDVESRLLRPILQLQMIPDSDIMTSTSGKVFCGSELIRGAFANASANIKNIIDLLHEAGLGFVLEEPCKFLEHQVKQFYLSAKITTDQSTIKAKVDGVKVKINSKRFNKYLRLSGEIDETNSKNDISRALRLLDHNGQKITSIKKADLNEEGRLLSDIVGKVLLCKPGSHDHLAGSMVDMLTSIVLRKKRNWGADLFRLICESLRKYSFGRILSLYLCEAYPGSFDMSMGSIITNTKRIGMMTLVRANWTPPREKKRRLEAGESSTLKKTPSSRKGKAVMKEPSEGEETEDEETESENSLLRAYRAAEELETVPSEGCGVDEFEDMVDRTISAVQGETHLESEIPSEVLAHLDLPRNSGQGEQVELPRDIPVISPAEVRIPAPTSVPVPTPILAAATSVTIEDLQRLSKLIQAGFSAQSKRMDEFERETCEKLKKLDEKLEEKVGQLTKDISYLNYIVTAAKTRIEEDKDLSMDTLQKMTTCLEALNKDQASIKINQNELAQRVSDNVNDYFKEYSKIIVAEFKKGEKNILEDMAHI